MGAGWMQCPAQVPDHLLPKMPGRKTGHVREVRGREEQPAWQLLSFHPPSGQDGQGGASVMETTCSLCPGGAAGGPEEREGNAAGAHLGRVRFSAGGRPHPVPLQLEAPEPVRSENRSQCAQRTATAFCDWPGGRG